MFSYTQIAKEIVDIDVYNLGTRLYLDGGVGGVEKLLIDNWQIYNLKDGTKFYRVTMPVLHLVLSKTKFGQAGEAMLQSINCTCSYFGEFGVCRHIVAVCQAMQKEFLEVEGKVKLAAKENQLDTNLIGNIFDVEQKSKIRKLQEHFEAYFAKSELRSIYWFELFVHEVKKTKNDTLKIPLLQKGVTRSDGVFDDDTAFAFTSGLNSDNQYSVFLSELQLSFRYKLRDYDMEKKVYYLMTVSLQIGGRFWWEFWQDLILDFSQRQQLSLWSEVYRWKVSRITTDYNDLIESILVSKTDLEKKQILEKLQEDYPNNLNLWLDFVLTSRYQQFLIDNIDKFDPDLLIDVAYILPEQREIIEIKIMNQVKVWSDFTKSGEYTDIINTLTKWAKLGRSDYFWETMKYIQIQHRKKPKLIGALRRLEE